MHIGLVAHPDFKSELKAEVSHRAVELVFETEDLFIVRVDANKKGALSWVFAQNIWLKAERHEFKSISEAQSLLKSRGRFWSLHKTSAFRRAQLIQDGLVRFKIKSQHPFTPLPKIPLGSWALETENSFWCSSECSSPFPDGEIPFEENRTDPPSRAYLKLWEALTVKDNRPEKGQTCVDLGSVPGGWTWVLAQLNTKVISVDKADLDPRVIALPQVEWLKKDAFTVEPGSLGKVDWLFSDIICYPPKLLELANNWILNSPINNAICTIKFQGETDFETMDRFAAIPGSEVRHLWHNKHEVTWFWRRP